MRRVRRLLAVMAILLLLAAGCTAPGLPDAVTEVTGEIHDTGAFRVLVPDGWRVIPVEDPFSDGRPIKTDSVFLRKGGESDRKVAEKPYIRIECGPDLPVEQPPADDALVRNAEQIAQLSCGEIVWSGYTADDYQGRVCTGRFALLGAEDGKQQYRVYVRFESGGDEISLDDRDVLAILASLESSDGAIHIEKNADGKEASE